MSQVTVACRKHKINKAGKTRAFLPMYAYGKIYLIRAGSYSHIHLCRLLLKFSNNLCLLHRIHLLQMSMVKLYIKIKIKLRKINTWKLLSSQNNRWVHMIETNK